MGNLTALSDLKTKFVQFGNMSDLLNSMLDQVNQINEFNKNSAGSDDIGKQYHATVDQPTKDLTDLLTQARTTIDKAVDGGTQTTALFDNTDQDLTDNNNGS
ncbi:hypothetical protein OG455_09880 [Kitasatospora sp. NBC_01287]|uniref:hypothetical protein n=1 Tax=Kitasatospora sp. NBC_01287 TaxID=2903573 RepID=UPI0022598412|nr:hypothetical protein [Kitasatospora sp. NBC_01287]MCX4745829.1 hypothetical protein [Kitasatospora sp. NBC_01287]